MLTIKGTIRQILSELLSHPQISSDKVFTCSVKEYRENRSLTANSYYWTLLHQYAEWSGRSDAYIHNDILEHYGQEEIVDEECGERLRVQVRADLDYHEFTEVHLRGTSEYTMDDDHNIYRYCIVLRGSHTYDTAEFSRIVDGLIYTIQGSDAPIQTLSTTELEKLRGYGYEV